MLSPRLCLKLEELLSLGLLKNYTVQNPELIPLEICFLGQESWKVGRGQPKPATKCRTRSGGHLGVRGKALGLLDHLSLWTPEPANVDRGS